MPALGLTARELEIVLLGAEGRTDKEIARNLGITHATVTTHWVRMREKLNARSRGHVIARSLREIYKEAQEELHQRNELFAILVQTLQEFAITMIDKDRKVLSWNPGVEKILGYPEEEWLNGTADRIFVEEDVKRGAPAIEQAEAEANGRAADNRWHIRRDGSLFWASGVLVPVRNSDGQTVCYSKVMQDLTRLKVLEDKIRELGGNPEAP